jgi:hypothetical protein
MKTYIHLCQYLAGFFLECEMFQTKSVHNMTAHILCSITIFSEYLAICEIMWRNMVQSDWPQTTI